MAELRGVEIWATAKPMYGVDGRGVTEQDLDEMIRSFQALGSLIKPYVKLGHDEEQDILGREKPEKEGMPAGGWVKSLYKQGKKVLADFVGVPDALQKLAAKGAYRRVSVEVYPAVKYDGNTYTNALRAVAFLGATVPAITTLGDIVALGYAADDAEIQTYESDLIFKKEDPVNKCPHCGAEMAAGVEKCTACGKDMKKFSADGGTTINFTPVDIEAIKKTEADKYAAKVKATEDENANLKAQIAKFAADKKTAEETARVEKFTAEVDTLTTSGKLPPALKDEAIAIFKALDASVVVKYSAEGKDQEQPLPAMFSAFLSKAAKLDAFKETLPGKTSKFEAGTVPEGHDPEAFALAGRIDKYMADNKIEDYKAARVAVLAEMKQEGN